jgi:oxygen-dependent protoporphyrinogen oxidase
VNLTTQTRKRVIVIGGGISGLAAASRLAAIDPTLELTLLEAGDRLGGILETQRRDGYLIERSADNFISQPPWAMDFCRQIGFADQLIPTSDEHRGALVVNRGRLVRVPEGFMLLAPARLWPLVTTPLLSPLGKLRLLCERWVRRRTEDDDESLAAFARRRLGREAFERIVQPLSAGIYTADPEKLSLRATLPRFIEMERRHGSLIRGARIEQAAADAEGQPRGSGARYSLFVTPREGMSSLVAAVAQTLPPGTVRLACPVESIAADPAGGWRVGIAGNTQPLACEGLIVATPAAPAARLVQSFDPVLGGELAGIESASTAVVVLAYRRAQIGRSLDGFGFVVPAVEKRRILSGSFSSVKFPGRAPQDTVLIRVFLGGACQSELVDLDDKRLVQIAGEELAELIGAQGAPLWSEVVRWRQAMPQYHLGHSDRVARIEQALERWPALALAGNAYHGVGIPHCIRSGELAADRVAAALAISPRP